MKLKKLFEGSRSRRKKRKAGSTADHNYPYQQEFERILGVVRGHSMVSRDALYSLFLQAKYCEENRIEGAFVECGVWKGGAVGLMALTNLHYAANRRMIHLFDAFEEICEPDETVDGARAINEVKAWSTSGGTSGRLVPLKGVYDHMGGPGTLAENRYLLQREIGYDETCLTYHQGWFQDTLPAQHAEIDRIAILRIDADWYASTKVCLDYLYDKVSSGGFVIIDDYGTYEGCRKAVDELLARLEAPVFLNAINRDVHYWIVP